MTSAAYLHMAFLLSKKANSKEIRPNPYVGAIVVDQNSSIVGEGFHQKVGEGHAEVNAIKHAKEKITDLSNCTLYVTLEPCSHFGKTPPCTSLIIENKISKVVIGSMDPNPLVSGVKVLQEAGIEVEICILPEINELNTVFTINQKYKRPKYVLKTATTINGKVADRNGNSKWISNNNSRQIVHEKLRSIVDAILTTAKTVIKDNATMNIRVSEEKVEELNAIVIDRNLDLLKQENATLNIFYPRTKSKLYLVTDKKQDGELPNHVELIQILFTNGVCDMDQLNAALLKRNFCEILVEAGGKLNASMIQAKQIDELYLFIAPSLIIDTHAINAFNSDELQLMDDKTILKLIETTIIDEDVLLRYQLSH
jgi:diaminohydroxyphosphoribosylaminopyrimidine deaminase/5-amino-6-(5-phosphoribosylamino)uracil reductase